MKQLSHKRLAVLRLESLDDRIAPTAGALDRTFGGDNKVVTSFGPSEDEAYSVALQADGKIVTAGRTYNGSNYDFAVARYRIDGTPDTSFDGDGKLTTVFGTGDDMGHGVAVQSDGRIVVVGYSNLTSADIALARYNPDGSLDSTFGVSGKVTTDFGFVLDIANCVAIQPDGKIVIAGMSPGPTLDYDFCVVRYNPDGSLDTGFSGDGKVVATIGSNYDEAKSMALQPDGRIVLGGISYNGSNFDFAMARFTAAGVLDTTFSGDGTLTLALGTGDDYCRSVAVQPDGKIVAVGSSFNGTNSDYALARLNVDGSLDTSFAGDGMHTAAFGTTQDVATAVTVLSDGKILVAGSGFNGSRIGFAVARYNSNGTLDGTFGGGDGMDITVIGSSTSGAAALAMQMDGRIVLAGYSEVGLDKNFALLRYKADGSLDFLADGSGNLTAGIGSGTDGAYSVATQADGKIVVAGISNYGSNYDVAVARFNDDGSLDASFDGDGKLTTPIGSGDDYAHSVAIQVDGKIVVAGYSFNGSNNDFALVRYNPDGSLDTAFDGDGMLTTPIGTSHDVVYNVTLQTDGKIVVAGYSSNGSNNDFAVARYNVNGSLDTSFDIDGKLTAAIGTQADDAWSVAVQPDGKIVVAGYSIGGANEYLFAVARYNANGSPDNSFDTDGKLTTDIGTSNDYGRSVVLQSDGKIIVAGYSFNTVGVNADFAVLRYNANGSLDTSFDIDGKVMTPLTPFSDFGTAAAIQADGKIVVAGYASTTDFGVVRYNTDGSPDTSFDGDGKLTTPVGNGGVSLTGLAVQANGKIVAVGSSIVNNFDFAVARIRGDNRAPVPLSGSFSLDEDSSVTVSTPNYYYEPDGDAVATTLLSGPAHGTLTLNPYGQFTYTPFADFSGTDSFSYLASDSFGGSASGSVTFFVDPINDDPTVNGDVASMPEDSPATAIAVLDNDSSSPDDNETLTITGVTQGASGSVAIIGGNTGVSYQPNSNFTGTDSFTYTIADGNGGTATATVLVAVTPVNDVPTANDDNARVLADSISNSIPVLGNDTAVPDYGETLTIVAKTNGDHGTVAIVNGGSGLIYTPAPGYEGADSFTYTINDGTPGSDSTATVSVAVLPAGGGGGGNTAPTLSGVPVSANIDEGQTLTFDASATDPDVGQDLTFSIVGVPATASIDPDTGEFSWATTEADGPDTFVFNVQVTDGFVVTEKSVMVIVRELNTAPVLSNVPAAVTIVRGNPFTFTATASDPDILNGVGNAFAFSLVGAPTGAVIDPDTGVFTFLPNDIRPGDVISGSVRVVDDGVPAKSDSKPITFTMTTAAAVLNGDLVIGGSAANDRIAVNTSKDLLQLVAVMNGATIGTFPAASVNKIVARGLGGNDKITVSPKVTKPTELWGGFGNDTMTGGAGSNVLIGGEGKDVLRGGIGRDVLLGGAGADKLVGGKGEDLLLGGVTDFETDPTGLALIVAEWNSGIAYDLRVAHLMGGAGGANGTAFLNSTTVHNDGVKDVLTGGKDSDWFVLSALDTLDWKLPELELVV